MRVGNKRLGILLYADDVIVISETEEDMQIMLNIAAGYGKDFRVKFSEDES